MPSPVLSLQRNRAIYFLLRSTICIFRTKLSFILYLKCINKQAQIGYIFSDTEDSRDRLYLQESFRGELAGNSLADKGKAEVSSKKYFYQSFPLYHSWGMHGP